MRVRSDDYAEVTAETADGQEVRAMVFSDPSGSNALNLMSAMGALGERAQKAAVGSAQLAAYDTLDGLYEQYKVFPPPVLPVYYTELYRRSVSQRACIDARVSAVAQQGWRIRPRSEANPFMQHEGSSKPQDQTKMDWDLHDRIMEVFEGGQPDYSFSDMVAEVWQDFCTTGNGYVEVIRDSSGKLVRFAAARSVTMRISKPVDGVDGFVQVRGTRQQWFARYGSGVKSVVLKRRDQPSLKAGTVDLLDRDPLFVPKTFYRAGECPSSLKFATSDLSDLIAKADENAEVAMNVNEMFHFACISPKDTPYGEPPILAAITDYLIAQNVATFLLSYFDNATIPRCVFWVKGDGRLNEKVLTTIENWIGSQNKIDALNQMLVVEVPSDTEIQIDRLSSEQLKDDSGLMAPRLASQKQIYIANRTPGSIVFALDGLNRAVSEEADRKYIEFVVRPDQRMIEQKFNAIIKHEFGSDDWVLDLMVPDLTIMAERRAMWQMLLTRGTLSINEVRQELRLAPIEGGDVPFLLVPGQGLVPIPALSEPNRTQAILDQGRDAMSTGNVKTPPRGDGDSEDTGKVLVLDSDVSRSLPVTVQVELALALEEMGLLSDDLKKALPLAYPTSEDPVSESVV